MAALLAFPGRVNLSTWQGRTAGGDDDDVATCANSPGAAGTLMITEAGCNFRWSYNATDRKLRRRKEQRQQRQRRQHSQQQEEEEQQDLVLNIDCDGS